MKYFSELYASENSYILCLMKFDKRRFKSQKDKQKGKSHDDITPTLSNIGPIGENGQQSLGTTSLNKPHVPVHKVSRQDESIQKFQKNKKSKSEGAAPHVKIQDKSANVKASSLPASAKPWNFVVDYNDHFETPKKAYEDLLTAILDPLFETSLQKPRGEVIVYDPYYCQGNMVQYLRELSFQHIINRNQDFYADIRRKSIPGKLVVPLIVLISYFSSHRV